MYFYDVVKYQLEHYKKRKESIINAGAIINGLEYKTKSEPQKFCLSNLRKCYVTLFQYTKEKDLICFHFQHTIKYMAIHKTSFV